jgi:hypothetical protein
LRVHTRSQRTVAYATESRVSGRENLSCSEGWFIRIGVNRLGAKPRGFPFQRRDLQEPTKTDLRRSPQRSQSPRASLRPVPDLTPEDHEKERCTTHSHPYPLQTHTLDTSVPEATTAFPFRHHTR